MLETPTEAKFGLTAKEEGGIFLECYLKTFTAPKVSKKNFLHVLMVLLGVIPAQIKLTR